MGEETGEPDALDSIAEFLSKATLERIRDVVPAEVVAKLLHVAPVKDLLEAVRVQHQLLEERRKFEELLDRILGLNLLQGFMTSTDASLFLTRLDHEPEQKKKLAEYAYQAALESRVPEEGKVLFFESGSTIANLFGHLAKDILAALEDEREPNKDRDDCPDPERRQRIRYPCSVVTNNLFALTAFVALVDAVEPTPGALSERYYGFFPFSDEIPMTDAQKRKEVEEYFPLGAAINRCDPILATCSNFSLLAGPRVGGRANALVKHAIHTNRKQEAALFELFHFEKLISLTDGPTTVALPSRMKKLTHAMTPPREYCQWVFPKPSVPATRLPVFKDHTKAPHFRFLNGQDDAKIPIMQLAGVSGSVSKRRLGDPEAPWHRYAKGSNILISLPCEREAAAVKFLQRESAAANSLLEICEADWRYEVPRERDDAAAVEAGVYHLECVGTA